MYPLTLRERDIFVFSRDFWIFFCAAELVNSLMLGARFIAGAACWANVYLIIFAAGLGELRLRRLSAEMNCLLFDLLLIALNFSILLCVKGSTRQL